MLIVPNSRSLVSKTSRLKFEAWGLSDGKKKRFKIAIMFSSRRRCSREKKNGFVKADVVK